jgi:hypothetical protein
MNNTGEKHRLIKRKKMKALKVAGLSVLFVAAAAYAADGVILKYNWKKGDVVKMRTKGSLEFGGTEISVNMVNQEKVIEVADDGTATVEQSVVSLLVNIGGQEQDMAQGGSPMIAVYKADGSIKEIRGENVEAGAYRIQNLMGFVPPVEAVKVGSKWVREAKADKDTGAVAYKAEYEVLSEEKISKWETFKIKYKVTETEGSDPAMMEGTVWLNKGDASTVKSDVAWTNVPMAAAPMPISGKFSTMREE